MAGIDRITEEKIKSAVNIVDVISDFIQLRKRGVEYQCLCPFHADETIGNFSINPSKGIYKCFACGASGDAIKFLMEYKDTKLTYPEALRYLANKYSIYIDDNEVDERWKNVKPATPKKIIETHKDMIIHPREDVLKLKDGLDKDIFVTWMRSLPWNSQQRERLEDVLWLYCVRHWKDGRVIFWQIDEQGRPHGGKMMAYHTNGKRWKKVEDNELGRPRWLHNQDGFREHLDLEHHTFSATLFGMHLLKRFPNATVNIVESEKTALICTTMYGDMEHQLWLACGGLEFLKVEALRPLIDSGRKVWIWPDKDGIEKWKAKVGHLLSDNFGIYTRFFDEYWLPEDGPKADVADINLRLLCHPETLNTPRESESKPKSQLETWCDGEPFLDPEEAINPELLWMRQRMSRIHSSGWGKIQSSPTTDINEIKHHEKINNLL